jgi:L-asparaginase
MLPALQEACRRLPVLVTCRVERGSMMFATYGFEGAEEDVRASGAVCVPFLSAPAARMALLCCLGAGLDTAAIATALATYDAQLHLP